VFQHVLVIALRSKAFDLRRSDVVNSFTELLNDIKGTSYITPVKKKMTSIKRIKFKKLEVEHFLVINIH